MSEQSKSDAQATPHHLAQRDQTWSQLTQQHWDLIVIGGGITGAGVLREATRRGLKALLIEQRDFAWGTSSRSSKMVHGGLRYLGQGDYKLTRHSLLERERLLTEVPGLVERMGYYFTLRQDKAPPPWAVKILLWLYDRLAGIRDHRRISLKELKQQFSGIDAEQLKGCFYYTDAVTDDARLVLRVLQESIKSGATALNYVKAQRLLTDEQGTINGVTLFNDVNGEKIDVHAKVVVNATGAWADQLRNQVNPEKRVRPLRGSHLVIPPQRLRTEHAITLLHPEDQRAVFVFPWEGRTVIGTTDLDHRDSLDNEASISDEEVDYLLHAANNLFPTSQLTRDDVISSWSGVRPVIGSEKSKDPSKERRDHAVWRDGNLITVSGGKLTTFRLIALDVLESMSSLLELPYADPSAAVFSRIEHRAEHFPSCDKTMATHLLARYGDDAADIIQSNNNRELQPIADTRYCLAECRWLIRHEAVVHLDDLLLRRTRLGQLLESGAKSQFAALETLFAQELGWDSLKWQAEVDRYQGIWRQHYSLPTDSNTRDTSPQPTATDCSVAL